MSYTVLARKYRPQTFADLVGQEHVTRTLSNAISGGRVAHAFLFTGVRGVGKTTSARILAKALNCERGPTPEPCNVCDACVQITQGSDLDVLEIDGASNNSVEDVRRLQESIPFRPARGRFKIVIVDEVHMLSTGAFNAFLKTLEEPPAHVKFIFATTESHKVPVTIRSRCQRYDFRLIPQPVIAERVREILRREQISADDEAVTIVAREAAGSMRDALTLLDQVVAFSGDQLAGREVAQRLGIADRERLFELAGSVLGGDGKRALEVIDAIATQGLDLLHFTRQWLDLLRDMVVLEVAGDHPKLLELSPEERARAAQLAKQSSPLELQRVFAGVAKLVDEVGGAATPRMVLEMGAVRLATRPRLAELSELIARVEQLARAPATASGGAARPAARPAGPAADAPAQGREPGGARGSAPGAAAGGAENPFQRFVPPDPRGGSGPRGEARSEPTTSGASPASSSAAVPSPASMMTSGVGPVTIERPLGARGATQLGGASSAQALAVAPAIALAAAVAPAAPAIAAAPAARAPVTPGPAPTVPAVAPAAPAIAATSATRAPVAPGPAPAALAPAASAPAASATAAAPVPSGSLPTPAAPGQRPPEGDPQLWSAIVEQLRRDEPRWAAMYEHGIASQIDATRVVVSFPEGSFFGRQAQTAPGSEALRRAAAAVLASPAPEGDKPGPEVVIRLSADVRGVSLAQQAAMQVDERKEAVKKRALSHPRVLEAIKVFPELAQKQDIQVD
jgi:DNA polymerase-3 subunit gamma/tau